MIVVDTSVWVDQFRGLPTPLDGLLGNGRIVMHPFVMGELLLNGLPKRSKLSIDLEDLPVSPVATPDEVAAFIRWGELVGTGVGHVDTHLLLSARLIPNGQLLTFDANLAEQASRFGLAYQS